eukprot:scaffold346221_cov59-Attheya_sp.AAC.1
MVFDPSYPEIDQRSFKDCEWKNFYGDVKEAISTNAPTARDSRLTQRSRTGYLIYLNMSPVAWQSKKQATVESSVFGAEFVAMK